MNFFFENLSLLDAQIAVSQTKKFTNSLFGLCMHWIGSGSKQHKKRRGKLVLMGPSDAAGGPRWLASAAEE